MPPSKQLLRVIDGQSRVVDVGPELSAVRAELQRSYGASLVAILFYGSCLRSGDVLDGLVDLYVIVDGYRPAYQKTVPAVLNWLLPPNVFYLELPVASGRIRSKYAVLSLAHLRKGTSSRWFHSYLWGRFSQPTAVLYARDRRAAEQVVSALGQAVMTFLARSLPCLPRRFSVRELWEKGLALSYSAELRAEKSNRKVQLFDSYQTYYEDMTRAALPALPYPVRIENAGCYVTHIPASTRRLSRIAWAVRRVQGKSLSLLRLVKATFTFRGGVDYILWKLERHSGISIEASEKVRRHPLVYGWGLIWRLYRRGVFR